MPIKTNKKVIACVPTYREPQKVAKYLQSCNFIQYRPFQLIIVNANPGDETSEIIKQEKKSKDYEIVEVAGQSDEFWSATVNRGLRLIADIAETGDWVLISNIDITFTTDIVNILLDKSLEKRNCQVAAMSIVDNRVISSGVQVKSWLTTWTVHPYAGMDVKNIPNDLMITVDYLPTRCMIFPVEVLTKVGVVNDKWLPHYGADYEFSRRLAKAGYTPYMCTKASIEVDNKNTGQSVYSHQTIFFKRILNLMNIKNPSNPKFRIFFVFLVYPLYAIPTATLAYLLRSLVEVVFNKQQILMLFGQKARGYSE